MYKKIILFILTCYLSSIVSGCVVRTYTVAKERVDQELTEGNRGYLMGAPKVAEEKPRKATRQVQVVELEMHPVKFIQPAPPITPEPKEELPTPAEEIQAISTPGIKPVIAQPVESRAMVMKKYTVRKGDTLQKISKRFYGTTKRWKEIYQVNQEVLKSPGEIYPGQVIEIPVEEIKRK